MLPSVLFPLSLLGLCLIDLTNIMYLLHYISQALLIRSQLIGHWCTRKHKIGTQDDFNVTRMSLLTHYAVSWAALFGFP